MYGKRPPIKAATSVLLVDGVQKSSFFKPGCPLDGGPLLLSFLEFDKWPKRKVNFDLAVKKMTFLRHRTLESPFCGKLTSFATLSTWVHHLTSQHDLNSNPWLPFLSQNYFKDGLIWPLFRALPQCLKMAKNVSFGLESSYSHLA